MPRTFIPSVSSSAPGIEKLRLKFANDRLRIELDYLFSKRDGLSRSIPLDEGQLEGLVSPEDFSTMANFLSSTFQRTFDQAKHRQLRKLNRLRATSEQAARDKLWPDPAFRDSLIVNTTEAQFEESEKDILALGPKFVLTPSNIPVSTFVAGIQCGISSGSIDQRAREEIIVANSAAIIRNNARLCKPNLSSNHLKAVKTVRTKIHDQNLVLRPADKGSKTVIMTKPAYHQKMLLHFDDATIYSKQRVNCNPSLRCHNAAAPILKNLVTNELISAETAKFLLPSVQRSRVAKPYGLVKVHKEDYPLRIIVPMSGTTLYNISKILDKILRPAVAKIPHRIHTVNGFIHELREVTQGQDFCLTSFDVVALYNNVDTVLMLDILPNILEETQHMWREMVPTFKAVPIPDIVSMAKVVIQNTFFSYNNVVYSQLSGLPMGSCCSVAFAELFMNHVECAVLSQFPFADNILCFKRYIDDILVVSSQSLDVDGLLEYFNAYDPSKRLRFTIEHEEGNVLPFLDIKLERTDSGLAMSVYRKATHSNRYMNPASAVNSSCFRQVVHGMRLRAMRYCSSAELLNSELRDLSVIFRKNGYDRKLVSSTLFPQRPVCSAKNKTDTRNIVVIPFVPHVSNLVKHYLSQEGFEVYFSHLNKLDGVLFQKYYGPEANQDTIFDRQNVIYCVKCDGCDLCYIGRTSRMLGVRVKEHLASTAQPGKTGATGLSEHMWDSGHSFSRDSVRIIDSAKQHKMLATLEATYIKAFAGKTVNNQNDLSYSKHISPNWGALLQFLR